MNLATDLTTAARPNPARRVRLLRYISPYTVGDVVDESAVSGAAALVAAGLAEWVEPEGENGVLQVGPVEGTDRG